MAVAAAALAQVGRGPYHHAAARLPPRSRRRGARLLLGGALTMATVVDWLTRAQLRRQLGALPVLYRLLEILDVRRIINRHCPRRPRWIMAPWSWSWCSTG